MCDVLVILQNAYGVTDDYVPGYHHSSFTNSHTGRRLREALPADVDVRMINASPRVGSVASAWFPPEPEHIAKQIEQHKPRVILACGKAAQQGLSEVQIATPVIYMPHPAYRALSKGMTAQVKSSLMEMLS